MWFKLVNVHVWLILVTGIFRNFCTETERGEFLSFRTGIPDCPVLVSKTKEIAFIDLTLPQTTRCPSSAQLLDIEQILEYTLLSMVISSVL